MSEVLWQPLRYRHLQRMCRSQLVFRFPHCISSRIPRRRPCHRIGWSQPPFLKQISFLIAYRSYHYAIIQTGSRLKWNFRRWKGITQWYERKSGTFNVGKVLHNGTNERPSLQSYGNMYSRDYNIGLSNLVWSQLKALSAGVLAIL